MKKALVSLLVPGCMVSVASAYDVTLLPDTSGMTWLGGNPPTGWDVKGLTGKDSSSLTLDKVKSSFSAVSSMVSTGWHATTGNMGSNNSYGVGDASSSAEVKYTDGGFSFNGRQAYGGELVSAAVAVSKLLNSPQDTLSSLTLNFDAKPGDNGIVFSAWVWNTTESTVRSLLGEGGLTLNGSATSGLSSKLTTQGSYAFAGSELNLTSEDVIVFVWGNNSGGALNTISNISSGAVIVPEPATATLSLMALAGLCVRRRRQRV